MTFVAGTVLTAAALNSELAAKTDLAMVKNAQTGSSYSYALADQTKLLTMSNASANTVLVTKQATVAWAADTQLRVLNIGAGATTLVADTGVTINNNTALAQWRGGVLIRMSSDVWTFVPFASGVGAAAFSDAATGTYTGFKYLTFTASGTLTVTTAGFADVVVVGGGGGTQNNSGSEGSGGGGAGGVLNMTSVYLKTGTLTVTVGAGGAGLKNGNASRIGDYFGIGGGIGGAFSSPGFAGNGGSGGGGSSLGGGSGTLGQGFDGGLGSGNYVQGMGGGGGSSAVGAAAPSTAIGGDGGAGTNITIAGTTPTGAYVAGNYAVGGGGGGFGPTTAGAASFGGGAGSTTATGTNGTANTGGGGGGGFNTLTRAQGGSGIVIVRVAV